MTINEINNCMVKLSPRSITVKDENNKTKGIVRGIQNFKECRPNVQVEIWKTIREYNLPLDRIYHAEGKWWFLHDKKWVANYFRYFEGRDSAMDKKYAEIWDVYEALINENLMEVVNCYII